MTFLVASAFVNIAILSGIYGGRFLWRGALL
jgi:hypothetical protein